MGSSDMVPGMDNTKPSGIIDLSIATTDNDWIANKHSVYIGQEKLIMAPQDSFTVGRLRERPLWKVRIHLGYRSDTAGWIHDRSGASDNIDGKIEMRDGCEYEFLDGRVKERKFLGDGSHLFTFHFRTVKKNGEEMDPLRH